MASNTCRVGGGEYAEEYQNGSSPSSLLCIVRSVVVLQRVRNPKHKHSSADLDVVHTIGAQTLIHITHQSADEVFGSGWDLRRQRTGLHRQGKLERKLERKYMTVCAAKSLLEILYTHGMYKYVWPTSHI
jgi:hypothetical protein